MSHTEGSNRSKVTQPSMYTNVLGQTSISRPHVRTAMQTSSHTQPLTCHEQIFISYLFFIFSYLLLCPYYCLYYYAYAICPYPILCISFSFFILDQTLSIHYLIHSLPFHSLSIAFPKV